MTRRMFTTVLGAAAVVAIVAGCSGSPEAAPTNTPPVSSSAVAAGLPHSGAPKVEHPLPEAVVSGQPCEGALTSGQLNEIFGMVPQGKPETLPGIGPKCRWSNPDSGAGLTVYYGTQTRQGLSALYQNTKPKAQVWRELSPVQGFPAVASVSIGSDAKDQFCQVTVGITDESTVDAALTVGDSKRGKVDPCELSARVADMVVANLKRKGGA